MIYGILICILYCPPNNHPLYYLRMYTEKVWPSHKFSLFNYNTLLYVHQKIIQDWWSQRHNIVKNIVGKFSDSKAVDRFFLFSLSSFFFVRRCCVVFNYLCSEASVDVDTKNKKPAGIMLLSLAPFLMVTLTAIFDSHSWRHIIILITLIISSSSTILYFVYSV